MPEPASTADVDELTRRGLRLAQLTVAYNLVEGVVAVSAGLAAGLVSLVAFGVDSGIETASAVLVGLRLGARLRHRDPDEARERGRERRTLRAVAVSFFVLAVYVTVEGVRSLTGREEPGSSVVGLALLVLSVLVMPVLAAAKRSVGQRLGGDPLILADAAQTRICVLLSLSTLLGLGLHAVTGMAWLDPVAGFVIAAFAVREGLEAWEGELVEDDD